MSYEGEKDTKECTYSLKSSTHQHNVQAIQSPATLWNEHSQRPSSTYTLWE
jgi:hypothetical protein